MSHDAPLSGAAAGEELRPAAPPSPTGYVTVRWALEADANITIIHVFTPQIIFNDFTPNANL
ncbi:hypothetical protein EYF80_052859 [Liparis tanakae]|uniref:Uncharacterized protein n=1 Tax=Liparis tanakae TaxID=230148 RepID=A0A4Z2F836_9TELE|nr:hypothetical protein EYF80_052859 [Liparis tanakae]